MNTPNAFCFGAYWMLPYTLIGVVYLFSCISWSIISYSIRWLSVFFSSFNQYFISFNSSVWFLFVGSSSVQYGSCLHSVHLFPFE